MSTSSQPQMLFVEDQTSGESLELFPIVWGAVERLTSPNSSDRHTALDQLLQISAPRLSPLVSHILASRLSDPEISIRGRIVECLANVLSLDENGLPAPEKVREHLLHGLASMRQRRIFAVLQVVVENPLIENHAAKLLSANPYSCNHLGNIMADRMNSFDIRKLAANLIGKIGFLDAIPTLERLEKRLESRQNGQLTMKFATPSVTDEADLLTAIKDAIFLLTVS